jgi:hypothetical protein
MKTKKKTKPRAAKLPKAHNRVEAMERVMGLVNALLRELEPFHSPPRNSASPAHLVNLVNPVQK